MTRARVRDVVGHGKGALEAVKWIRAAFSALCAENAARIRPRHARRAWKREAPGGERLPFVCGRFPWRDQTYAWWFGSLWPWFGSFSPKMCAAYAAACVRRSMPSFWNRADT